MTACDAPLAPADFANHRPELSMKADELMRSWADLSIAELASAIQISRAMAMAMREMILNFPDKERGSRAIEAYTGVVFRALAYDEMSADERILLSGRVRIISSLYGWLRPDDIIKAYRLDFTTPLAPGGLRMAAYWKADVTKALLEDIEREGSGEILDLLPGDAAKCIDWAEIRRVAAVCKVDFRTSDPAGTVRTPHANLLKTLRGQLLRQIITDYIGTLAELRELASDSAEGEAITFII